MIGRHLPNTLTALRIGAVPCVAWLVQEQAWGRAALLIAAAAVTDALDGWIARRYGWQSWLGGWLDPIADKLLVGASYLALAWVFPVLVPLAAFVLLRDVVIVAGASAYRALVGPLDADPTRLGKLASPLQLAFVVLLLAGLARHGTLPAATHAGTIAVGAVTLASGVEYVWEWSRRARRAWPNRER